MIKEKYFYFAIGSLFYLIFKLLPLPSESVFLKWNVSFFLASFMFMPIFLLKKNTNKSIYKKIILL